MIWVLVAIAIIGSVSVLIAGVGLLLPSTRSISRMAHFNRSPSEIWALITNFSDQPSWRTDLTHIERLPNRAGLEMWKETDRHGQSLEIETVGKVPPQRLVRRIANDNHPFSQTWTMEVATYGEVTSLTITEENRIDNPVFRFISWLIMNQAATIDEYLCNLGKRIGTDVHITTG